MKNYDKAEDGYEVVVHALNQMTGRAQHINEMKRKHEHAVRVQEIQSTLEEYEGEDLTTLGELVLEVSPHYIVCLCVYVRYKVCGLIMWYGWYIDPHSVVVCVSLFCSVVYVLILFCGVSLILSVVCPSFCSVLFPRSAL